MTIRTPEEAAELWCPLTMGTTGADVNFHKCMPTKCMAWRWGRDIPRAGDVGLHSGAVRLDPNPKGYCGMAGDMAGAMHNGPRDK